ncbi:MAG: hypothetical protein KC543_08895 [Myxococcales bacterium]|nr:hypothetical protein [Myxococcales bacterium]
MRLTAIRTPSDVDHAARALFGEPLPATGGVSHVTAVWDDGAGKLYTLKIGEATPKSEADWFALHWSRARADAIVNTGKVLRSEPRLTYGFEGLGGRELDAAPMVAYRRERLGLMEPPRVLILTRGALSLDHPALSRDNRAIVWTTAEAAADMQGEARARGIEVIGSEAPTMRGAVAHLRGLGCRTISIEAGPSTSLSLYDPPTMVDELLLTVYEAPSLPDGVRGGAILSRTDLEARFGPLSFVRVQEPNGPWAFARVNTTP